MDHLAQQIEALDRVEVFQVFSFEGHHSLAGLRLVTEPEDAH